MSTLAVFGVLAGGTAYAANTVFSTDIVDGEVKSVDVGDGEIKSSDVKDQSLTTFDVSTFLGADVVDGTLTSADIQDFSLGNGDLLTGSVDDRAVTNGALNDEDISESLAVDFAGQIGTVNATSCVYKGVDGLTAHGDHLLLTPSFTDADGGLVYGARYDNTNDRVRIHVCNFTNAAIDDGITHFNLLNIDAQ